MVFSEICASLVTALFSIEDKASGGKQAGKTCRQSFAALSF